VRDGWRLHSCSGRQAIWTVAWAVIAGCLAIVLLVPPGADAQGPPVSVEGRVLWIAAATMVVAAGGQTVTVDLTGAPLGSYLGLQTGSWVRVTGSWMPRGRLQAAGIDELPGPPVPFATSP
jgi:hypothetical protein